jgi:hypothetical protein
VHDLHQQMNGLQRNTFFGGCILAPVSYTYEFRFATNGASTQVYTGDAACVTWTVTTFGVQVPVDAPYGTSLMFTLHKLTGMPLPSWWSVTLSASVPPTPTPTHLPGIVP